MLPIKRINLTENEQPAVKNLTIQSIPQRIENSLLEQNSELQMKLMACQ